MTPARPKQRALLALLLLRRGEVVPGAQLIEALWGEEPPGTAQTALHGHISNLRKLLGADRIRTRPPGYLLQASRGRGRPGPVRVAGRRGAGPRRSVERAACLRDALSLWRGEPLADLHGEPFAEREIVRLEELRLAALEDRIDADLALGRQSRAGAGAGAARRRARVSRAPARAADARALPLRPAGRRAPRVPERAPGARRGARASNPGPALQQLELRILRQDPAWTHRRFAWGKRGGAGPLRAQRRPQHRLPGDRRRADRPRADLRLRLPPREGLGGAAPRALPRTARLDGSPDPLRQARHRPLRPAAGLPDLETRMDDVRAVMDAVGSRRAVLFGYSEGAPMAILFAATYPERTQALILYGAYAKRLDPDDDYPWAPTRGGARRVHRRDLERDWGFESDMKLMCPSRRRRDGALVGRALPRRRQPRRHQGDQRDELADRRPRAAAGDPRPDARRPPRHRLRRPTSRRAATSPSASPAPGSSSCRAPTTSSASTPIRSSTSSSRSSPTCGAARVPADRDRVLVTLVASAIAGASTFTERQHGIVRRELAQLSRPGARGRSRSNPRLLRRAGQSRPLRHRDHRRGPRARHRGPHRRAHRRGRDRRRPRPWRRPRHRRRRGRCGGSRRGARVADRHGPRRRLRARVRRSREPGASRRPRRMAPAGRRRPRSEAPGAAGR